ncbi:MAG: helicase-related protein, partial [Planctomycetaceae bacterium]
MTGVDVTDQPDYPQLRNQIRQAMLRDRFRLRRSLDSIQRAHKANRPFDRNLAKFQSALNESVQTRERRSTGVPCVTLNEDLPVTTRRDEIAAAIRGNQVVIVCGETGSGKSTQLPMICLDIGRGIDGLIGHTQPRRIAARSVAARVAEELGVGLGQEVGFKIRFTDSTGPRTFVKLMTDGILLAESQNDRFFEQYDTIIIDEAHERSLNIDFLLGRLRQILNRRPDMKLIITSATIDAARFAEHFGTSGQPAPVIEVAGRTFPVDVRYRPLIEEEVLPDSRSAVSPPQTGAGSRPARKGHSAGGPPGRRRSEPDIQRAILDAVDELGQIDNGDILIFMPTERDIHETSRSLRGRLLNSTGRVTEVLPLYARLTTRDQNRIFQPGGHNRRIVIATNVAESSLTVPGIRYVIDSGTARISRYSSRSRMQRLPIEPISKASASQRAGRCGRVAPGICIRLYSEADFNAREEFTPPEIQRTNLASVILQTKALRLGPLEEFPFLEPPRSGTVADGCRMLFELGALDERNELTETGRKLSGLPVDPRVGRMILAGQEENCLSEVLIIAAALELQDPRERPLEQQQAADLAHARFQHEDSDFLSYLQLWDFHLKLKRDLSRSQLRKACQQNFLS